MDKLRLDTLAVRVVEWHNRHPLARRIGVQHVQSIGYVALPFLAPGGPAAPAAADDLPAGASLRERALARAAQGAAAAAPAAAVPDAAAVPAFDEAFLESVKPQLVARWAQRHARALTVEPTDGPVRRIGASAAGTRAHYAMTALIETAGSRSRVLVGPGEQPEVLGLRLWSRPRMAALVAAVLLLAGVVWIVLNLPGQAGAPTTAGLAPAGSASAVAAASSVAAVGAPALVPVVSAAPASSVTVAAAAVASAAPAVVAGPTPTPTPTPTPDAAASAPVPQAPPVDVEPRLGRISLPALNLPKSDAARTAARDRRSAAAASAASAAGPLPARAPAPPAVKPAPMASEPPASAKSDPSAAMAAAAQPGVPTFAVTTRILRTRAESEQVTVAMQALLATTGARGVRVEIVPNGADWRVVGWPFARRSDADRARALLASRGIRVEVVDF